MSAILSSKMWIPAVILPGASTAETSATPSRLARPFVKELRRTPSQTPSRRLYNLPSPAGRGLASLILLTQQSNFSPDKDGLPAGWIQNLQEPPERVYRVRDNNILIVGKALRMDSPLAEDPPGCRPSRHHHTKTSASSDSLRAIVRLPQKNLLSEPSVFAKGKKKQRLHRGSAEPGQRSLDLR